MNAYISANMILTKKYYQSKKLAPDYKILARNFHIDTSITLAATTGCAKNIFRSFSSISLTKRNFFILKTESERYKQDLSMWSIVFWIIAIFTLKICKKLIFLSFSRQFFPNKIFTSMDKSNLELPSWRPSKELSKSLLLF